LNIEALADEVRGEHRAKFAPKRRRVSQYAGLRSKYRLKYTDCERVSVRGVNVRKLDAAGVEAFQRHIRWLQGDELAAPKVRKAVV
jgi:hypothetical protein